MRTLQILGVSLAVATGFHVERAQSASRESFRFMSYNVQNLFDTEDDPETRDEEFTPQGRQKWTEEVLKDKMTNLASVIKSENPAILALQEIENQAILERFVREHLRGEAYVAAVTGPSDDARGIRNAVVSRFPVLSSRSHQVWRESWREDDGFLYKTRDILEVTLDLSSIGGGHVTVLSNHWPSRRGGPAREFLRLDAAETMRQITEEILRKNPDGLVISAGDFNDELQDRSFREPIDIVRTARELLNGDLATFFAVDYALESLPVEEKGTYYYHPGQTWNSLDHVLIAKGENLLRPGRAHYRVLSESTARVTPERFLQDDLYPQGCEIIPHKNVYQGRRGNACPLGASDHFGIATTFELR